MNYTPGLSRRTMMIFKSIVKFFDNYAAKKFGENKYKLDWYRIYENLFIFNLYYNYNEWNIITKNDEISEEDIEKYTYELCNNIIKNGERIDLFFEFENNDNEKIINEITKRKNEINNEKFNSKKCYKCKYFIDRVSFFDNTGLEISLNSIKRMFINNPEDIDKYYYFEHNYNCIKRDEIIKELMKNDTYPFNIEERLNRKFDDNDIPDHFYFNYINDKIDKKWILKPIDKSVNCKYFEDSGMDLIEFLNRYYEIE